MTIPFVVEWIRVRRIKTTWTQNNKEDAIKMIVDDINRSHDRVLIYGGSASIYNDDRIITAIKSANERKVRIQMVLEESVDSSKIKALDMEYIFVGSTAGPVFKHHFRVVDYDYVFIEKPHLVGSDDRCFKRLFNTRFLPGDYSREFTKVRKEVIAASE